MRKDVVLGGLNEAILLIKTSFSEFEKMYEKVIPKWMPKAVDNCIQIDLWEPSGLIFRIWAGFMRCQFFDEFGKKWVPKVEHPAHVKLPGDGAKKKRKASSKTTDPKRQQPSRGQGGRRGGGKPALDSEG